MGEWIGVYTYYAAAPNKATYRCRLHDTLRWTDGGLSQAVSIRAQTANTACESRFGYYVRLSILHGKKMSFKNLLATFACLGLAVVSLASNAKTISVVEPKPANELWLNFGEYSYHFDKDKGLNNRNFGLGIEYRYSTRSSIMVGEFHNSDWYTSHYAAWHWQPLGWGPVRFGVVAGAMDGYPKMLDGGWFLAVIPTVGIEYKHIGANLFLVPSYQNRLYGAISLQMKFRVF